MLTKKEFAAAASILNCEPEVIEAVTIVEAPRGAFDAKGRLTILFEPHIFWKELKKIGFNVPTLESLKKEHPDLLSPVWNSALYGKYSEQWNKLKKASGIHLLRGVREAAYKSASYGAFQILGGNAEDLGYKSVFDFVNHQEQSEWNQLDAFIRFIKKNGLDDELREKDWAGFARGYNGPLYHKNQYDKKLAAAYKKLKP